MSYVLRKDPDWTLALSSTAESGALLTLLSEDGCQVQVPAELLVAVSPLVKSMMSALLPPAFSPPVISIPAVTGAILLLVAEILTKGTAVVNENMGEVKEVFKMMRIEAILSCCVADREVKDEDFTEGTDDYSQSEIYVKNEKFDENEYYEDPAFFIKVEGEKIESNLPERNHFSSEVLQTFNNNKPEEIEIDKECDLNVPAVLKTRGKPFTCDQCDYKSTTLSSMKRHMTNKHKLKQIKCDKCNHRSSTSKLLKQHMKTHTGEKPFASDQCDYKGARVSHLVSHYHKATFHKLKPLKCDKCLYRAGTSKQIYRHMLTHEKRFTYDQCAYKGARLCQLVSHKANNHLKLFKCDQCAFRAATSVQLQLHILKADGHKWAEHNGSLNEEGSVI